MSTAIIIPAYNPDERLAALVAILRTLCSSKIILVDDGSLDAHRALFDHLECEFGCLVARHAVNRGKGAALKTGIRVAMQNCPMLSGVVTADADGQHLAKDIARLAAELPAHPDSLLVGTRDFSSGEVPLHNLLGNRITSLVFYRCAGVFCPDTQTGLRAIPARLLEDCLAVPGDRYEYEMNVLCTLSRKGVPFVKVPISTVYLDRNSSSHFRPLQDSVRIYKNILKFGVSSLVSAGADLALFTLLTALFFGRTPEEILFSTVIARCASGVLNFTLNRNWLFASRGNPREQGARYFALFLTQMLLSWGLVTLLSALPVPLTLLKVVSDCGLFALSYYVQQRFIFTKRGAPACGTPA